jgi:hypothetical protein
MMLLGLSARAAVTGRSLCLARGQHTFDVFIVLKTGGDLREKIFFNFADHYPLVKTPTKSISDFGRRLSPYLNPVFRENTKNGSHTLPHSGIKYGKPVSVNLL